VPLSSSQVAKLTRGLRDFREFVWPELALTQVQTVDRPGGQTQSLYPEYKDLGEGKDPIDDIGPLTRLRHPSQRRRTLTICNGIHSRSVFWAMRCPTGARVREANEIHLEKRFPYGEFAILLRIPVVENQTLSPDLQDPNARQYEWCPNRDGVQ
jgi:hypothetical protein